MINPGDLIKEFVIRLWDDISLWRLRRQYAKILESIKHQILIKREIQLKIKNIEAYYNLQEGK